MNITELDSFNLADAVKFNSKLNPRIWQGQKMRPEVREKLLEIAEDFREFLGVDNLDVKDITVSGSNASYHYTPYSDIDLHLVVDVPKLNDDAIFRELFDAKKYQYNDLHNIKIGGYDVELYVEDAGKPPVSQGIFSVKNNDWINIPRQRRATVDDTSVKSKYEDIKHRIESALKDRDFDRIDRLAKKIKAYRQAGLDAHGEFGPENIAFKILRNQGYIGKLYDARNAARDAELSLAEQNKVKKPFVYGYKSMAEDATATPDGVNPTTQMFLNEKEMPTHEEIIQDFLSFAVDKLDINTVPKLRLKKDPAWSIRNKSFGRYDNDTGELIVALGNRHIMDILRTLAHELTHRKQDEREDMPPNAGETGSPYENEAHARAGMLMRDYAAMHPEYFEDVTVNESSGYIPTRAQANDPRFKMALTVDVHPGQTGKEANKMALKTDKQGKPALLIKSANLIGEAAKPRSHGYNSTPMSQIPGEQEDDLGNQEATGPEFEPQMPAGTTKVDVTDLTDWYKLGMDISDMDDADPEDYNQGPPQTVIVFPSDEAEQGYLKQFKRLGLKTHDLDPDVAGGEDVTGKHLHKSLAEELQAFKDQDLFEIKMTGKNLAKLARDIKDAKVGLEFEMIVPNATIEDDGDMEPDYDRDERVRDIDEAVGFFDDGDYNGHRQLRDLRSAMQESYWEWRSEALDHEWYNGDGFEYFTKWLEDNDPFDDEEAEEEARNQLQSEYGDELDVEEFEKMLFALVDEKRAAYVQEQWDDQSVNFDDARQEYEDEHLDDYSEEDWLRDQGIRFASDVESNFGHVTWPYYTSNSNQGETDIKRIALEFMNDSGLPYDNIAIANSYHGRYELWDGNQWIDYGSEKPDFCFAVEPDGSLEGDDSDDAGLEFVSPPIPLEQVGDVMSKVQKWAGRNGVYTGKTNKTSMHTNISVPGYDLKNLDYLKAALLLGDEYVLREFDRIGNTYAKPAIEKVRELVRNKPEKAKELLDKMKSQLNAEASKLIHSGTTDKFTSINTKDNRIEFRSPGGDYLSDIADNPQKMTNMINRMVVAMDAAMDPNKYKEEYQKKLYKMLTGQESGREAKSGIKKDMKKDDKDLLNIFSRYAAGELPKAALKSFVRQAQLQRKVAKDKLAPGKYWWNASAGGLGSRIEVVGKDELDAKIAAAKAWGLQPVDSILRDIRVEVLRPYEEKPEQSQQVSGLYKIFDTNGRLIAGDEYGSDRAALARAGVWAMQRNVDVVVKNAQGQEIGRVSASGEITPTAQQPAQQNQGNWGIWIDGNNRFANQPGTYARGETPPLYRFPSREAAESWLAQQRAERAGLRTDIDVREIPPRLLPGSTLDLQRQRAAQASPDIDYEIYNRQTGEVVDTAQLRNDNEAMIRLNDYRNHGPHRLNPEQAQRMFGIRRGPGVASAEREPVANIDLFPDIEADLARARAADAARLGVINTANEPTTGSAVGQTYNPTGTGSFTGQWLVLNPNNQVIYRFGGIGNNQSDANRIAMDWLRQNPRQMVNGVSVIPELG